MGKVGEGLGRRWRRVTRRLRGLGPMAPPEKRFRAMTEGTVRDWAGIERADADYERGLADRLLAILPLLAGEPHGFAIDRLQHGLQAASLAHRDGRDEAYVVCALLHDIGAALAPADHAAMAATILRPYVSEADHWMVAHHDIFQGYYFLHFLGHDREARERFRGHPHFQRTADFARLYDQSAFDPDYPTLPLSAFAPILRRVLARRRS
jgi:predicted HD phosphohydrolase